MDYKKTAAAETQVWQAYYKKDPAIFLQSMTALLINQYGINNHEIATQVANKFSQAYKKFAALPIDTNPEQYNVDVLPLVNKAYQALKQAIQATWDPKKAAVADLAWWVARRHSNTLNPEIIGGKIAGLYHILYGEHDNYHFIRAGYLRAVAGRYRDQSQDKWGGATAEDWRVIQLLLELSYQELSFKL